MKHKVSLGERGHGVSRPVKQGPSQEVKPKNGLTRLELVEPEWLATNMSGYVIVLVQNASWEGQTSSSS